MTKPDAPHRYQIQEQVSILAGLFAGRKGVIREMDEAQQRFRVRAEGMPTQETVELTRDQIQRI